MNARQAAAFTAAEATGLSKSDIARITGTHRSQVSRWTSGEQRPSYDRTMRLAAHLARTRPDVAEELVAAAGYGPPEPDPPVPPDVLAVMSRYTPDEQAKIIEELRKASEAARDGQQERAGGPSRRDAGGTRRAG